MIIVNLTTYPKRDKYLYKMLKHFSNQTLRADKIILWLCKEEYDNDNLPTTIQKCLDENLLTDIMWVDKNIYCHKRYDVFKYYNDAYNIIVDDDTYYPEQFVKELYDYSSSLNKVCCYWSYVQEFNGVSKASKRFIGNDINILPKNALQGSCICWPPNSFPIESFDYEYERNLVSPQCDESWLTAWCIKKHIHIYGIKDFISRTIENGRLIDDADNVGLCYTVCKSSNGVRFREQYLSASILTIDALDDALKIWPLFNIKYCAEQNIGYQKLKQK